MRRQFILAAKLIAAQNGMSWKAGSCSVTFDRLLDQATAVPISELRLQGVRHAYPPAHPLDRRIRVLGHPHREVLLVVTRTQ